MFRLTSMTVEHSREPHLRPIMSAAKPIATMPKITPQISMFSICSESDEVHRVLVTT